MSYTNDGINQSGGSIKATSIAVGQHATINNAPTESDPALEEVRVQLQRILHLVSQQGHSLPNQSDILQSAQTAQEELSKPKPNKVTLKSLLTGIAESVRSVASIATAAEALKVAVGVFLG